MNLLKATMTELGLSARAHDKILRVARTIADLDASDAIRRAHVSEAINYRMLDRQFVDVTGTSCDARRCSGRVWHPRHVFYRAIPVPFMLPPGKSRGGCAPIARAGVGITPTANALDIGRDLVGQLPVQQF